MFTTHGIQFREGGHRGSGSGNFQDTAESALGAKALAPALDCISIFPYKSKLRARRLFFSVLDSSIESSPQLPVTLGSC